MTVWFNFHKPLIYTGYRILLKFKNRPAHQLLALVLIVYFPKNLRIVQRVRGEQEREREEKEGEGEREEHLLQRRVDIYISVYALMRSRHI